jgi:hypothetical protein
VHYREVATLFDPSRRAELAERTKGAYFLHLWNEVLRQAGVDKTRPPPPGSFMADLFGLHPGPAGLGLTQPGR